MSCECEVLDSKVFKGAKPNNQFEELAYVDLESSLC